MPFHLMNYVPNVDLLQTKTTSLKGPSPIPREVKKSMGCA